MSIKLEFIASGKRVNCVNYKQAKKKKEFWSKHGKETKIVYTYK